MSAKTEPEMPRLCPNCGRPPRVIGSFDGRFYLACPEHLETKNRDTIEEATHDWNSGEYEKVYPQPTS